AGTSIAISHSRDRSNLREIEKRIGKTCEHKEVPTPEHIIEKQLYNLADRLERVDVDENQINRYMTGVSRKLEWLSQEALLKRLLSLEFNRLLEYYKDAPYIENIPENQRRDKKEKKEASKPRTPKEKDRRTADRGMERIYVSAGKSDGFYAGNLIDILNHTVDGHRVDVGRIDLMPGYSLFDVKKADARRVVQALSGYDFVGQKLYAEIADPEKDYTRASSRKKRDNAPDERRRGHDRFKKKSSRRR
ncbi:MAG: DbpA RNA binding domain-containing protein, partial [Muribaculum sp.]|nr:DbpA RNA binding domain-containing protein [Muribaculum sp.]